MPSIGDICIELQCQQGINSGGPIPEFAPRSEADDPEGQFMPPLYHSPTRTCSVFIPVFPSAQFFLTFNAKPVPDAPTALYVFRFLIGKEEISTWHCGPEDGFKGCMMFALCDKPRSVVGGKQVLMLGDDARGVGDSSDQDRKIEVQVFRAAEKRRVPWQSAGLETTYSPRIAYGASLEPGHPKRHFLYHLIDRTDKPFATFRLYYRSWGELYTLKLRLCEAKTDDLFVCRDAKVTRDRKRRTLHIRPGSKPSLDAAATAATTMQSPTSDAAVQRSAALVPRYIAISHNSGPPFRIQSMQLLDQELREAADKLASVSVPATREPPVNDLARCPWANESPAYKPYDFPAPGSEAISHLWPKDYLLPLADFFPPAKASGKMKIEDPLGERAIAKAEAAVKAAVAKAKAEAKAAVEEAIARATASVQPDPAWDASRSPNVAGGMVPPQQAPAGPMPWNWVPPNPAPVYSVPASGDYWPPNPPPILNVPAPGHWPPHSPHPGFGVPVPGYWQPPNPPPVFYGPAPGPAPVATNEARLWSPAHHRTSRGTSSRRHVQPLKYSRAPPPSWEQIPRMLLPAYHTEALRSATPAVVEAAPLATKTTPAATTATPAAAKPTRRGAATATRGTRAPQQVPAMAEETPRLTLGRAASDPGPRRVDKPWAEEEGRRDGQTGSSSPRGGRSALKGGKT